MSESTYQIKKPGEYCTHCNSDNGMPFWVNDNLLRICNTCGYKEERKINNLTKGDCLQFDCGCAYGSLNIENGQREKLIICPIHDIKIISKTPKLQRTFVARLITSEPDKWKNRQSFHTTLEAAKEWALGTFNEDGKRLTAGVLQQPQDSVTIFEVMEEFVEVIEWKPQK